MKERPIIFSAPMIRAILDGRKTQTRRVVGSQPPEGTVRFRHQNESPLSPPWSEPQWWSYSEEFGQESCTWEARCPYGVPGDELWVRERFRADRPFTGDMDHDFTTERIHYYADDHPKYRDQDKWKPSIHMPRKLSRIQLLVKDVRVERVQEISEEDAKAEGAPAGQAIDAVSGKLVTFAEGPCYYRAGFQWLWNSINGKKPGCSWADSPWCWVVVFEVREA